MKYLTIITLFIILSLETPIMADETGPYYVALGDSITAGYHRDGNQQHMYDFPFSFSGRIAISQNWEVANLGITNLTSTEFLEELKKNQSWMDNIHKAKWITLEIGANDFIRNTMFFPYIFEGKTLDTNDLDKLEKEKQRVLDEYEQNLKTVVQMIQKESSAHLIVLNHYYLPLPGITGEFINSAIIESNKRLAELSNEKGFMVADLATTFSAAMTLSFLTQNMNAFPIDVQDMDPHPSAYGQKLIASTLLDLMENKSKNELIPNTLISVLWMFLVSLFHN